MYHVDAYTNAKFGVSSSSHLFAIHNHTFRDTRTHAHTACYDNTVQLRWNGVKRRPKYSPTPFQVLNLPLELSRVKFIQANQHSINDFMVYCNRNVVPICHHFTDIHMPSVSDLDLDGQNLPRLDENLLIKSPYATLYLLTVIWLTRSLVYRII